MDTAGILLSQPPPSYLRVSGCLWLCLSRNQCSIIVIFITLRTNLNLMPCSRVITLKSKFVYCWLAHIIVDISLSSSNFVISHGGPFMNGNFIKRPEHFSSRGRSALEPYLRKKNYNLVNITVTSARRDTNAKENSWKSAWLTYITASWKDLEDLRAHITVRLTLYIARLLLDVECYYKL